MLLRNYDYDPRLFEATVYRARWGARRVLGTGDCLWGLVDGVNDAGLAVSLTFGGRREIGEGFGVPLVIRYLLEVCDDVVGRRRGAAAAAAPALLQHHALRPLRRRWRPCIVAPDRPAQVTDRRATTNHPETVEWPEHAAWVNSVERLELAASSCSAEARTPTAGRAMLAAAAARAPLGRGLRDAVHRRLPAGQRAGSTTTGPATRLALALERPVPDAYSVTLE